MVFGPKTLEYEASEPSGYYKEGLPKRGSFFLEILKSQMEKKPATPEAATLRAEAGPRRCRSAACRAWPSSRRRVFWGVLGVFGGPGGALEGP